MGEMPYEVFKLWLKKKKVKVIRVPGTELIDSELKERKRTLN